MTYLGFHLLFNLPALLLLLWLARRRLRAAHWRWVAIICGIVLVATTPWDNWAVYQGIWTFDWQRTHPVEVSRGRSVVALPAEEYAFLPDRDSHRGTVDFFVPAVSAVGTKAAGRVMRWHYFLHLVCWTTPLLLGQWVIGWRVFRRNVAAVFCPALIGMIFFSACDSFAMRSGIWRFDAATNSRLARRTPAGGGSDVFLPDQPARDAKSFAVDAGFVPAMKPGLVRRVQMS